MKEKWREKNKLILTFVTDFENWVKPAAACIIINDYNI